ncbi:MAG: hypothetical protein HY611_09290 [Elusimicrobia bacterium]|nr:hypothetical protein [Elusimicrobiota bacterium]
MKNALLKAHKIIVRYALFYAPVYAALSATLFTRYGDAVPEGGMFDAANNLGFAWILSLAYVFLALLFYRRFRETLLARLAGFKEGDERERLVTADAARATFLLMLALQIVLLVMSLTAIRLVRNPDGHGMLSVGMRLSSEQFDIYSLPEGQPPAPGPLGSVEIGGPLLPPNMSILLLLLLLVQIGAFKLVSSRRYEGLEN